MNEATTTIEVYVSDRDLIVQMKYAKKLSRVADVVRTLLKQDGGT